MKEKANKALVQAEKRESTSSGFGLAADKVDLTFGELVDQIDTENYYMTTQEIPETSDGFEELFAEPLIHLKEDFPLQPKIFGNLVPYQMNLWFGKGIQGTSSGLHHDYHDNMYILISGRKQFRLFPPSDIKKLYVKGNVKKVHKNGLICYSDVPTRSDGANPVIIAQYNTEKAEKELAIAEAIFEKLEQSDASPDEIAEASKKVSEAEEKLDEAMEASLEACEFENDGEDSEDESSIISHPNFSRITVDDLRGLKKSTNKEFPLFKKAKEIICEVKEGQMLYLPASWFHEVTSFSSSKDKPHCAMNYWVYPPCIDGSFEHPYEDDYWLDKWNERMNKLSNSNSPPLKRQRIK